MFRLIRILTITAALISPAVALGQVEAIAQANRDLELSFTIAGRVSEILVDRGEQVELGQPLLRLDDRESVARLELLRLRAESDLEAKAAEAEWQMAVTDEKRIRSARSRDAAAEFEVERAELEALRRRLAFELFEQRQIEARHQLRQAEVQHDRYTLRSPGAGYIEEIMIEVGESADALRPVIRVVQTDPLVINAPTPLARSMSLQVGDPVWAQFRLPGHDVPLEGTIVHIARVADSASVTRLVRIEVPNTDDLPAGSPVLVWYSPPEGVAANAQTKRRPGAS